MSKHALHEARRALVRGDTAEAYAALGGDVDPDILSVRICGETSSLIRAGLIAEAVDRIDGFLNPNFEGRRAYAAARVEARP